jgi:photosystem II stability/assembly factor-like uncharacterized protein
MCDPVRRSRVRPGRPGLRVAGALLLLAALLPVPAPRAAAEAERPSKGPEEFKSLKFRFVGPAIGGRVNRVAGVSGDPQVYYAATASGGIWKSEDGGIGWKPIFDDQIDSSVGSIAVSPSHPAVVYAGGGEANIRGNVKLGHGIYKSVDAGRTWTHVLRLRGQIGTMVVHPADPDVAFAAVLGSPFGPGPERGVYRTRDGGRTWGQVLKVDADTGASDVCMDRRRPDVLFAGTWQARRRPWEMTSGGPGSGLHVSRDGGDTWTRLTGRGLPEGIWGKVGCAVAPSDSGRVYALIEAEKGGLYRSDDGGDTWILASDHRSILQRPWYYTTLVVDPTNADIVWFPQVPLLRSTDGGRTIRKVPQPHHGDHHDIWIDPHNPMRILDGNDGGVDISWDGGKTWHAPRLPIGQLYHVSVDDSVPYRVSGALQDLGTASGPSDSLASGGITLADWHEIGGGEAGHTAHDPSDPNLAWAGEYLGIITRYDHRTGMARNVSIYPDNMSGHGAADGRYRFQWTAPIHISPHDPKTVYHAGNVLFRTTDGGQSWTAVSPDLTRNDPAKQKWSGGPITGDNTGVEHYCTIFAVAESRLEKGLIWAGSDDGLVHVTRDGGARWSNVTAGLKGLPEWATVALIEPSPHDAAIAYVVAHAYRLDDDRPYLYKTSDYGRTWRRLTASLPQDVHLHAVREDPKKKGLLYAGTERGVMMSPDDGATWRALGLNLPTVAVHDLIVKDDDLVLGTHGRSIWILDDLTPIRDWSKAIADRPVHLFPARPAIRWERRSSFHDEGPGENPPRGAILHYWLKQEPKGEITLEILDSAGAVIRVLSSRKPPIEFEEDDPDGPWRPRKKPVLAVEPGVQRIAWDLTTDPAETIWRAKAEGNHEAAPRVVPGTYTARLTVEGKTWTTPVDVRADPRLPVSGADLEAQVRYVREVQDQITRVTRLVREIRSVRDQVRVRIEAAGGAARAADWVRAAGEVARRCDAIEGVLHNPEAKVEYDVLAKGSRIYSRLGPLLDFATTGSGAPTQGMREVLADLTRMVDAAESDWRRVVAGELAALESGARAIGMEGFVVPRPPSPGAPRAPGP